MNQKGTGASHGYCTGKKGGRCFRADHLCFPPENGTIAKSGLGPDLWKKDMRLNFISGIEAKLRIGELFDRLTHALKTAQPNFIEDQAKDA